MAIERYCFKLRENFIQFVQDHLIVAQSSQILSESKVQFFKNFLSMRASMNEANLFLLNASQTMRTINIYLAYLCTGI